MATKFHLLAYPNYVIITLAIIHLTVELTSAQTTTDLETTETTPASTIPPSVSPKISESNCSSVYIRCWNAFCLKYVHIIKECHPDYTNLETIEKCQNFVDSDFINDASLFAPMTSTEKNITYANIYCGICNFENELFKFQFWTPWLFFKINMSESPDEAEETISSHEIRPANDTKTWLDGIKEDDRDPSKLICISNETIYECRVSRVVPLHLAPHSKCCHNCWSTRHYAIVNTIGKSVSDHLKQNYSEPDKNKFCSTETTKHSSMESFCNYRDEYGDTCSKNMFLSKVSFSCGADGYIWAEFSEKEDENVQFQCSNLTSKENYFYVCGLVRPNLYKNIRKSIFNTMDDISAFFLFLYLVLNTTKQNLRSLAHRVFYSYSISLFGLYIFQFPLRYMESCVVKYYIFFYIWQSHSFWILITSFDLWRLVYNSLKLKKVQVEGQTKRYVVYCILGWGLPALLLAALYPTLTEDQKFWSCPSVSGFENEVTCSSSCEWNKHTYNFGWVTIAIFLVLAPCLLLLTCVLICLSMRNKARSNVNRTYSVVLLKVAIMMGLHWMILVYMCWFNSEETFGVVYEFILSFHGCFIFFAFGLEKNTIGRFVQFVYSRVMERMQCVSWFRSDRDAGQTSESAVEMENKF